MFQRTSSFFFIIMVGILCYGCESHRRNAEAVKVVELLKEGDFQKVKQLCHYKPTWDPNDSIFHQSMSFIHSYMVKYGEPSRDEYKTVANAADNDKIVRVYFNKASDFDPSLRLAYLEIDFDDLVKNSGLHSPFAKGLLTAMEKTAAPFIDNIYLIRMKKNGPVTP